MKCGGFLRRWRIFDKRTLNPKNEKEEELQLIFSSAVYSALRADFAEVLERIDAAAVVVGPFDFQGVIANEFGREGGQRAGVISGKDLEQGLLFIFFLADGFAHGAGAARAEQGNAVDGNQAILPMDLKLFVLLQIEVNGNGLRGHRGGVGHRLNSMRCSDDRCSYVRTFRRASKTFDRGGGIGQPRRCAVR